MRLGIDFGTCFSSAAFMEGETLTLIKDSSSLGFSVPSSIFVTAQEQVLVGKVANNRRLSDPTRYRRELKRDLGKDVLLLGNQAAQPEQLIAHVLRKIKSDADMQMTSVGEPAFTGAVITIPATYQEPKPTLMLKAAVQAGFVAEEVTLLEEPVAAALYYARKSNMSEGEILLVYDLGGGTFDTALLQRKGDGFEYLAVPAGIERCGGVDFDRAIYTDLIKQDAELQDLLQAIREDKAALAARVSIGEMCIDLKHQLSDVEDAELSVVVPGTGTFLEYTLKRATFEQMIASAIEETVTCCCQMIQHANISYEQINRILLVGGSCRIPCVQQRLQQEFKRPISMAPDLELVVCQGAALYAAHHPVNIVSPDASEGYYTTINAAIEVAQPKSRIVVRPGTYRENLVIEREIEIIGTGPRDAIIIESAEAVCIQVATPAARVRGLTIRHTPSTPSTLYRHGAVVIALGHLILEDCAIDSQVCGVSIWGAESNATFRSCQIHASKNAAVAFSYGGQGTIEKCDLFGNAAALVDIRGKGTVATIRQSTIHDGQFLGISISTEGQATLEESEICGNTAAGIQVYGAGSSATLRQCRVHAGKDEGIAVWQKGQVTVEDCAIFDNLYAGVLIGDEGSAATIKHSRIYDGKYVGIAILNKGRAVMEECDLYGNVGAAIRVGDEGSQIIVRNCQVHEGMYAGIVIWRKSQGELINNQIFRNGGPGIRICNPGSNGEISGGKIWGNAVGLVAEDEAEGMLKDCTIEKNRIDTYIEPGSSIQFLPHEEEISEELSSHSEANMNKIAIWRQIPKLETTNLSVFINPEKLALIRTLTGHTRCVVSVALSPDGQTLASGSDDSTIKVWNMQKEQLLHTLPGYTSWILSMVISSDGQTLVSGSDGNTIKMWNMQMGQLLRTLSGHAGNVHSVAISPDGQTLASGSGDSTIKIWDMQMGQLLRTLTGHAGNVYSVAISPDGQTLASGSADNTIKIWDMQTGQLLRTLTEHSNEVWSVALGADEQTLVSASRDNTIKMWNVQTGQVLRTLSEHTDLVFSAILSADGQTLVSASNDKTIKIWGEV